MKHKVLIVFYVFITQNPLSALTGKHFWKEKKSLGWLGQEKSTSVSANFLEKKIG